MTSIALFNMAFIWVQWWLLSRPWMVPSAQVAGIFGYENLFKTIPLSLFHILALFGLLLSIFNIFPFTKSEAKSLLSYASTIPQLNLALPAILTFFCQSAILA